MISFWEFVESMNSGYVLKIGHGSGHKHEPDPEDIFDAPGYIEKEYITQNYDSLIDAVKMFRHYLADSGKKKISHLSLSLFTSDSNKFGVTRPIDIAWWNGGKVQFGPSADPRVVAALKIPGHSDIYNNFANAPISGSDSVATVRNKHV